MSTSALDGLAAGVLVRPRLSVWAHRSDLDQERLAFTLEQQFSHQVATFRAGKQAEFDERAETVLDASKQEKDEAVKLQRSARKGLYASALAMLLITNPLLDLLLLLVAVSSGVEVLTEAFRESGADLKEKRAEREHEHGTKDLKQTVGSRKRAFRSALALRIPPHSGHSFRLIPATHSDGFRPPIPTDSGHRLRSIPASDSD